MEFRYLFSVSLSNAADMCEVSNKRIVFIIRNSIKNDSLHFILKITITHKNVNGNFKYY